MVNKSTLIGIVLVVAVGAASPAFAQRRAVTAYDRGLYAYDMVSAYGGIDSFSPNASGGGSYGYNETLLRDDW